jgi:hypothetical protein
MKIWTKILRASTRSPIRFGSYWSVSAPVCFYNLLIGLPDSYIIADGSAKPTVVPRSLPFFVDFSTNYSCNSLLLYVDWIYLICPWSMYCFDNMHLCNQLLHEETSLRLSQRLFFTSHVSRPYAYTRMVGTAIILYSFTYNMVSFSPSFLPLLFFT